MLSRLTTFKLNVKPESSATYVTREGLIPGVFLYMYGNIVDLEESLITYSAHELFYPGVLGHRHVFSHVGLRVGTFSTYCRLVLYPYLMSACMVNQTNWFVDFFCTLPCLFVWVKVNPALECSATYVTVKGITLGVFPCVYVNIAAMEEGLQCLKAGFSIVVGLVFHCIMDLVESFFTVIPEKV